MSFQSFVDAFDTLVQSPSLLDWFSVSPLDDAFGYHVLLLPACYDIVPTLEIEYELLFLEDHLNAIPPLTLTLQLFIQLCFLLFCLGKTLWTIVLTDRWFLILLPVPSHIALSVLQNCSPLRSLDTHTSPIYHSLIINTSNSSSSFFSFSSHSFNSLIAVLLLKPI